MLRALLVLAALHNIAAQACANAAVGDIGNIPSILHDPLNAFCVDLAAKTEVSLRGKGCHETPHSNIGEKLLAVTSCNDLSTFLMGASKSHGCYCEAARILHESANQRLPLHAMSEPQPSSATPVWNTVLVGSVVAVVLAAQARQGLARRSQAVL